MKESTLIKNKIKFSSYIRKFRRIGCKTYMTNDLLIYGENICAFHHILGSPFSYMTLHPIPSEFLIYEENFVSFLSKEEKQGKAGKAMESKK
jgi:hypothetical protein